MLEEKLTPKQLREKFEAWDKQIKSGVYDKGGSMSHPALRRRAGLVVLGGLYPQYEKLSEEEKKNFGFDVESLLKRVYEMFNSSSDGSEYYGDIETLIKQEVDGRKISVNYRNESRIYWIPSNGAWISGKGITLTRAYRIFEEDDKTMRIREVQSYSERDTIIQGLGEEIRRILRK